MIYSYKGYYDCDCKCDIQRYSDLVIATELKDNNGTSITNCAEKIAKEICEKYNIKMKDLVWIEHYDNSTFSQMREYYDRVFFQIEKNEFRSPKWIRLTDEEVNELIEEYR
jgi:DNA-directed RNA polymerase subunit H (RpoH/RPB5)